MASLTSREDLIEYCLRKLGKPVIQINVDHQQCEDRIDEALLFFSERHFDGVEKGYFKYQLTQEDIDRKYIETNDIGPINGITGDSPDGRDIVSVVKVFQFGNFTSIDMFDIRYQLALTDYFGINRGLAGSPALGLATYDSTKRYIKLIQDCKDKGKTVIFSSHIMSEVDLLCDDMAIIHKGQLLYNDTMEHFRSSMKAENLTAEFIRIVNESNKNA